MPKNEPVEPHFIRLWLRVEPDILKSMDTSAPPVVGAPDQKPFAVADYGYGLIHLAWYLTDQERFLMFGSVELYPLEFPAPLDTPEKNLRLRRLGSRSRLYVKRTRLSATAALDWYLRCMEGQIDLPGDLDAKGAPKFLASTGFVQEPQWPHLVAVSDQIPFVSQLWHAPRIHLLLQPDLLADAKKAASDRDGRKWLSEQMFVNLDAYPELVGSVHLVAPDPNLRGIDHGLRTTTPGYETSVLRFLPRMNRTLEGSRVILIDRRQAGLGGFVESEITSTELEVHHPPGTTGEIEMVVLDRAGAILTWSRPTGFIQSLAMNLMTPGPEQKVIVPATGSSPQSSYVRALAGHNTTVTAGQPRSAKEAISLWAAGEAVREMKRLDDRYPERWFHGDQEAATKFIRRLISSATQRLWIVDPYFTTVELIGYALATSNTKLPVLIVTSAKTMTKKDRIDPKRTAAEVLNAQLSNLSKYGNFTIRVLKGIPAVHDRFLVVDDAVWFSGNSLHTIGERAGMVVKLRNSAEIIANLEDIFKSDRIADWQEWLANRQSVAPASPTRTKAWPALGAAISIAALGCWWALRQNNPGENR